jgi:predicted DCC family thiol-disulfide oxidoreductase YuxK
MDDWRYLVLYDGTCGLCDRSVQWLLRHDRKGALRYAPLQGSTARQFVDEREVYDTMMLVERDDDGAPRLFNASRAFFEICRVLGGGWRAASWLRVLPVGLTDSAYHVVARNRYRWFGQVDACRIPSAEVRDRFLP